MRVLSLCDGIGTGAYILNKLGFKCEYHAVELESWKTLIAQENNANYFKLSCLVETIADKIDSLDMNYDLVLCGFTCSSLTSQGNRKDWDGESKIFWSCLEILNHVKKINPNVKFLFENVASMKTKIRDEISKELGVEAFKMDASICSEQARVRYYWFNWNKPNLEEIAKTYQRKNFLDEDGLEIFSFSKSNRNEKGKEQIIQCRFRKDGKAGTLLTAKGCKGRSTMNQVITKKMTVRDLSIGECKRLQGLDDYEFNCHENKAYTAIGEGWSVQAVLEILKMLGGCL